MAGEDHDPEIVRRGRAAVEVQVAEGGGLHARHPRLGRVPARLDDEGAQPGLGQARGAHPASSARANDDDIGLELHGFPAAHDVDWPDRGLRGLGRHHRLIPDPLPEPVCRLGLILAAVTECEEQGNSFQRLVGGSQAWDPVPRPGEEDAFPPSRLHRGVAAPYAGQHQVRDWYHPGSAVRAAAGAPRPGRSSR